MGVSSRGSNFQQLFEYFPEYIVRKLFALHYLQCNGIKLYNKFKLIQLVNIVLVILSLSKYEIEEQVK